MMDYRGLFAFGYRPFALASEVIAYPSGRAAVLCAALMFAGAFNAALAKINVAKS